MDVAKNIQARNPASWGFPVLEAVVEAPTLRPDGTVLAQPGYDAASRLYLVPSPGLEDIEVPEQPCSDHIEVALEVIRDAIGDFPFVDQSSYANAVGAMMTSVCRHIISGPVPLALFDATTQGTGKTLLAEVIAIILTGRAAELMSAPAEPEEWRKQLTSILIEAPPLVIIDNVTTTVDWGDLAKVITGEMHRDRLLGKSQTVSVPVRCSWIATGNNLQLGGDMARRCYWIRMDAGCSDPFRRTGFKHERLKEYLVEHRRDLLIAMLTLARAWFAAGQPKSSVPPVGSFERWTEVVAGILEYARVEGFLANSEKLFEQSDIERTDWETFLEAIEDAFQGAAFTIAELWERLNEKAYEELVRQSVLTDRAEELRNALPDRPDPMDGPRRAVQAAAGRRIQLAPRAAVWKTPDARRARHAETPRQSRAMEGGGRCVNQALLFVTNCGDLAGTLRGLILESPRRLNGCDADTYNDLRGLAGTLFPFRAYENMHTSHFAHHVARAYAYRLRPLESPRKSPQIPLCH